MYVEAFPNGDGYFHQCADCEGTIGESDSMVFADGDPFHIGCFDN